MASTDLNDHDDPLGAVERWFVGRGLPHFVERRPSVWTVWSRAAPLLAAYYIFSGLWALDLDDWSVAQNVAMVAAVVVVGIGVWCGANCARGRPALARPTEIGPIELGLLMLVPMVPSLLVGQWLDALGTLTTTVVVLAAIGLIASYGVGPLLLWSARRTIHQLDSLFAVITRALPLLLLTVTFLFINAEVWQVAARLDGVVHLVVLGLFFVLGAVFLVTQIPRLVAALNRFADSDEIDHLVVGTPAEQLAGTAVPVEPLRGRELFNAGLLSVFSQAIQIALAAITITVFLIGFGLLAIPADTVAGWTTTAVDELVGFDVGDRRLSLTVELLRVATFLGAFTGMYFTVVLTTDSTYRSEFTDDLAPTLRQALAVRHRYRRALRDLGEPIPSSS